MRGYLPLAMACGLLFGGLLLVLPPGKFMLALVVAGAAFALLRQPWVALGLFALSATSIPYTTRASMNLPGGSTSSRPPNSRPQAMARGR